MHFILRDWYQTFVLPKPFSPPERESAFLHYYACRYGRVRISSAALGVGTWLGYFIADYALCQLDPIFATAYERQFLIHAAGSFVLVLFFLFCLLYGDFPTDEQRASRTVLGGSFAAAFFILLKQFAAPSPYEYLYYAQGTIVLLIFWVVIVENVTPWIPELGDILAPWRPINALNMFISGEMPPYCVNPPWESPWISLAYVAVWAVILFIAGVLTFRSRDIDTAK